MTRTTFATLLGAAISALTPSAAHADVLAAATFDTFHLSFLSDQTQPDAIPFEYTVLSHTAERTAIRLDSTITATQAESWQGSVSGSDFLSMSFDTLPGYRITRVVLSGSFEGELASGAGSFGAPDNRGSINAIAFLEGSVSWTSHTYGKENITDPQHFELAFDNPAGTGLPMDLRTSASTYSGYGNAALSHAYVGLSDAVLTVYTDIQAVPEPATWLMLAGGLPLLGCAARRRRRIPPH